MKVHQLFTAAALVAAALTTAPTLANGDEELVEIMSSLQYFTHKATLAVDAKNKPLASFYAHELEEYTEMAEEIKNYDGHPVGKLVKSMLVPALEEFEAALNKGTWDQASSRLGKLIQSCNSCHQATEHGFIEIERRTENPFLQSFKP